MLFTIKFYQIQHYSSGKNLLQKKLSYAGKCQKFLSISQLKKIIIWHVKSVSKDFLLLHAKPLYACVYFLAA